MEAGITIRFYDFVTIYEVGNSPHRAGKYTNVVALPLHKNVTDARLERTSSSADVFKGTPYGIFTCPVLRYWLACKV